jgi:glycosyltransferase involved in cell wall biosynthesis
VEAGPTLGEWVNAVLSFPDEDAGWVPFALVKGRHLARRDPFDCVLTSGPPHSTHLIGAWLSKSTGRPWIADFRDPLFLEGKPNRISRRLDARLEAFIMRRAALVLTTTRRFADELERRHPAHAGKIRTLPNGFDPDDFAGISRRKAEKFTIAYLGSLYVGRDPEPVLRAVARLIEDGVIPRDRIVLRFAGACENAAGKPMRDLIARYGLDGVVELPGWVPRQQAFELMAQAHVVLLLAENQGLMIPAKVYDYFGIGSDILALTEEGATADLLRETGRAAVHRPHDDQGITRSIEGFYRSYVDGVDRGAGAAAPDGLSQYSRERLARELADLLDAVSRPAAAG